MLLYNKIGFFWKSGFSGIFLLQRKFQKKTVFTVQSVIAAVRARCYSQIIFSEQFELEQTAATKVKPFHSPCTCRAQLMFSY